MEVIYKSEIALTASDGCWYSVHCDDCNCDSHCGKVCCDE